MLIDWIFNKKKSTYVLTAMLVICYASAFLPHGVFWLSLLPFIGSTVIPFAIFLVWISDSEIFGKILSRRWTTVVVTGIMVVYGMFANTFANSFINGLFKVDPAHFAVTRIFLTTVYLLIGIFQPLVMLPIGVALLLFGGFLIPVILLMDIEKKSLRYFGIFLLASVLISASSHSLSLLERHLPLLTEQVALNADFNENHRCTAPWPRNVDKVVFLQDGSVLAHISGTRNYEIFPCN